MKLLLLAVLLVGWTAAAALGQSRPNIVVILADDLGWSDVGCYGADLLETPNIDRLAKAGLRFTDAYAMPVCSPTRAALLTGRHAARLHMTIWSEGALNPPGDESAWEPAHSLPSLPHSERTLASVLQAAGYLTAVVGKWHLGDADHYPESHGFDVNIGGTRWGAPNTFWWPYQGSERFSEFRYVPHLEYGQRGEYLTDRLTSEALQVIDRAGDQPFFLLLAHHAPHTPIEAKESDVRYFESKLQPAGRHQNPVYAAMVRSLDQSVGRVVEHLQARGLVDNTLFVFASDNGGYIGVDRKSGQSVPVTDNAPLRSGKGSCYEGGVRIPLIVQWPGITAAGSVCDEPVAVMDLFPTLLAATGLKTPSTLTLDGLDLTPLFNNPQSQLPERTLYFHYPHHYATTTPVSALRSGPWKLLEYLQEDRVELYNLDEDLGESHDLALEQPARAAELQQELHAWRIEVNASLPTRRPPP